MVSRFASRRICILRWSMATCLKVRPHVPNNTDMIVGMEAEERRGMARQKRKGIGRQKRKGMANDRFCYD